MDIKNNPIKIVFSLPCLSEMEPNILGRNIDAIDAGINSKAIELKLLVILSLAQILFRGIGLLN